MWEISPLRLQIYGTREILRASEMHSFFILTLVFCVLIPLQDIAD